MMLFYYIAEVDWLFVSFNADIMMISWIRKRAVALSANNSGSGMILSVGADAEDLLIADREVKIPQ